MSENTSETVGLHTKLTADSGNFSQVMVESRQKLADLAVDERKLRNEIALAEAELKKQSAAFGNDSAEALKASKSLSELYNKELSLKASVKDVTDGVNKQTQTFAKNSSQAESTTNQLKNGFMILKGLALGYAGKTLFDAIIGGNAQFEQYMTSFEVLLGSADKAQKQMDELTQFAAKTPLETKDVVQATQLLLSYGLAQEDVMVKLQQLGDVSQGSAEKMQRVSLAYGQMLAKNKVTGEELRQMVEAGVPIQEELAKVMGISKAELMDFIEKGKVGIPELNKALENMTSEGGKFFGMMDKQSQTMTGLFSTLKDNINIFAREVGDESFGYLKTELLDLMTTLNTMSEDGSLKNIAGEIGEDIAKTIEFVVGFIKILWEMREAIVVVGGAVVGMKVSLLALETIQTVIGWIKAYNLAIKTTTSVTEACTIANKAMGISMVATPWGAIAAVIGLVAGALVTYALTTKNATSEVEEQKKRIDELNENYEASIKSIDNASKSSEAQGEKVRVLKDRLYELDNQVKSGTLSDEEARIKKEEINGIVQQLNNTIPNLKLAINGETGAWNLQRQEIDLLTDSFIKLTKAKAISKAYQSKIDTTAQQLVDLKDQRKEAYSTFQGSDYNYEFYRKKVQDENIPAYSYDMAWYKDERKQAAKNVLAIDEKSSEAENKLKEYSDELQKTLAEVDALTPKQTDIKSADTKATDTKPKATSNGSGGRASSTTQSEKDTRADEGKAIIDDLKWQKDMEYITEADFYAKLGVLRDEYFTKGSDDWQGYTLEIKKYNDKIIKDKKDQDKKDYEERLSDSKQYIEDRNFYNNWGSDSEIEAWKRVYDYTEQARRDDLIDQDTYIKTMAQAQKNMYTAAKTEIEETIKTQSDALKEKYQNELDMKQESVKEQLALTKSSLAKEKELIQSNADAQIKAIDDVINKRKQQKEDADDNLKLDRLKNKLAYENDDNNKKSIQKEIDKLNTSIADKAFDRDMEAKKAQITAQKELDLARIDETDAYETDKADRRINALATKYKEKMSGTSIAAEIYNSLDIKTFENIGTVMGENIAIGINNAIAGAIQGAWDTLNSIAGIKANGTSNVTNITKNYNMSTNVTGNIDSPATTNKISKKIADTIELNNR